MLTQPIWFKITKFATVGFSAFLLDMFVTYITKEKLKINQYIANGVSFVIGATYNFILNRLWTFQSHDNNIEIQAVKFGVSMIFGLGIATVIIYFLNEKMNINFYISKIVAIAVVMVWNFTINNFLVFAK